MALSTSCGGQHRGSLVRSAKAGGARKAAIPRRSRHSGSAPHVGYAVREWSRCKWSDPEVGFSDPLELAPTRPLNSFRNGLLEADMGASLGGTA